MSLNEGQLDDITDNAVTGDDGTVQTPSILPTTDEPITLIPENNELRSQAVELESDFEKKLPSMDVTLKLVEDNKAKLVDLEDVEADLLGDGKVSKDIADQVNASFEGLFDGMITRHHYTQQPSTLNIATVKQHTRARIAKEEATMVGNFKLLVDQPVEDAKRVLAEIEGNYMHYVRADAGALAAQAIDLPEAIASSKNMIQQFGRSFLSLATIDLTNPVVGFESVNGTPRFEQLCLGLKKLMSDAKFKAFVLAVGCEVNPQEADDPAYIMEHQNAPVTIAELIAFYRYSGLIDYLDQMTEKAEETLNLLEKVQEECQGLADNPQAVREYLTQNAEVLTEASQYHVKIVRRVLDLSYLNFITGELFDFFQKQ